MLVASRGAFFLAFLLVIRVWNISPGTTLTIGWKILRRVRQQQGKLTNKTPLTLSEALAAS